MKQFSLNEYLKNPNKKTVTRDGRSVRIICTDRDMENYPVVGLVKDDYEECVVTYNENGHTIKSENTEFDLFFAPEKHEGWITIHEKTEGGYFPGTTVLDSKEQAERIASTFATMGITIPICKIEWEE